MSSFPGSCSCVSVWCIVLSVASMDNTRPHRIPYVTSKGSPNITKTIPKQLRDADVCTQLVGNMCNVYTPQHCQMITDPCIF